MFLAFFWTLIFSLATAISIALLGQRDLISGNLLDIKRIVTLLINWRFIISMSFAVVARISFIMTNNAILKIPELKDAATTITTFTTTSLGLICVILVNYYFLDERITITQAIGAVILLVGIFLISK